MTPRQRTLIQQTFPALQEIGGPLTQLFYGRLFQLAPSARPMFKGDIRVQGRKLMDMLSTLVESLDNLESRQPMLRALGQRHAAYGVKLEHYETLRTAFAWALAQALQAEFSGEVKAAWLALIDEVNIAMKAGASQLDPPQP